jgi:hypothetical protein
VAQAVDLQAGSPEFKSQSHQIQKQLADEGWRVTGALARQDLERPAPLSSAPVQHRRSSWLLTSISDPPPPVPATAQAWSQHQRQAELQWPSLSCDRCDRHHHRLLTCPSSQLKLLPHSAPASPSPAHVNLVTLEPRGRGILRYPSSFWQCRSELGAYTLSHSTSPSFFMKGFFEIGVL